MSEPSFSAYLGALKSTAGLMAGVGAIVPAVLGFQKLAPPFLSPVIWLVPALATAIIFGVYYFRFRDAVRDERMPPLVKNGLRALGGSIVLLVTYLILVRFTTTIDPLGEERYQIGFGKARWGLTEFAQAHKNPTNSVREWMLQGAYYREDGPEVLWTTTAILSAGVLLTLVFMATFIGWSMGWAMLAKHHASVTHLEPLQNAAGASLLPVTDVPAPDGEGAPVPPPSTSML